MKTRFDQVYRTFVLGGLALVLTFALMIQPAAAASGESVNLAWDANSESNLAGYNVYRSTQSGAFTTALNSALVTGTFFMDSTVEANGVYYYAVAAVNTSGQQGAYSSQIQSGVSPIVVPVINQAPVVNAGIDQTITLPAAGTLTSVITDDGSPHDTLTIQWSVVTGSGVTLSSPTAVSTPVSFAAAGVFTLRLTVSDGELSTSDDVVVTVAAAPVVNQAPVVNAGIDQTITLPAAGTLTSVITDDGSPHDTLTIQWSVVTGSGVTLSSPTAVSTPVSFAAAGTFTLRLTVSDGELSTSDDVVVTVAAAPVVNQAPVVNAGIDQTITLPAAGTLTSVITDDGSPHDTLTIQWSVVTGSGVTLSSPTAVSTPVSFAAAGTFTLRLTVSDGELSTSDDVVVTVKAANKAPVVMAGAYQTITLPATATLTGIVTDDGMPTGTLTYKWSVVTGSGVTLSSPTAVSTVASFAGAGTYTLRLLAKDGALGASDDLVVTVKAANKAPVVMAGAYQTITLPATATLAGIVTDDGMPTGTLTYKWSVVTGSGVTLSSPTTASTVASFATPGIYRLRLLAKDGALGASDDLVVTVKAAGSALTADDVPSSKVKDGGVVIIVSRSNEILQDPNTPVIVRSNDIRTERMDLSIDDRLEKTVIGNALSYSWDTRLLSGNHTVSVTAYEGNTIITTQSVTINVQ